ncbi:MAG TPA: 2-phospho-L-lactate guanylyltransferase [Acidimicrobiales bacterium]|jgi:2-phospho-L-lactate/phosphoenolpyruvate guanylyltransferase|nr:2-phospho-L-lactate guanylyltransferase [Acidimicrobiales bacterium]
MPSAAVVVPIKAFDAAKSRLAPALDAAGRADLARAMATRVLEAAAPLPVFVATDDAEVAAWAVEHDGHVVSTEGLDLNGSIRAGIAAVRTAGGFERVVVAHADLPFASRLARLAAFPGATLVPDRGDDGTNVLCIPTAITFEPMYGPQSFGRHLAQLRRLGLPVRIARIEDLAWDVDRPADLPPSVLRPASTPA